jgi:O-antigen/teichoic acid export membrane protein
VPQNSISHRSFAVRYLALFGGETFSKLCVMAAFAYLARVLAPSDYGIIEQALAITVFFVLGVESGMGLYGTRVVAAAPERVPQLVSQVMLLRAALGVPAYAAIVILASFYKMAGLGILAVYGIAVLLTPFLTQWVFQGLRQMPWVAAGTAARNLTFVALIFALVTPGSDIRLVAVAEVGGIAMLAIVNALFLHRRLRVRLDTRDLVAGTRRLLGEVWYMGFSDLTWACLWFSPALIVGWASQGGTEQVAWIGASVRIVLALHTFVYLYFFNLLPNLSKEFSTGLDQWRALMQRSIITSLWPACLIAVGGTLLAPVLIPAVFGAAFTRAVVPFQIAIWMIPATWFSGHFRFSLIAAGQQWWDFVVSSLTALVTVGAGVFLSRNYGSTGAASALLLGGVVNTAFAMVASRRYVGRITIAASAGPPVLATVVCLLAGAAVSASVGVWAGTLVGCLLFAGAAVRHDNDLVRLIRNAVSGRPASP